MRHTALAAGCRRLDVRYQYGQPVPLDCHDSRLIRGLCAGHHARVHLAEHGYNHSVHGQHWESQSSSVGEQVVEEAEEKKSPEMPS
jgi:hypothetical protein